MKDPFCPVCRHYKWDCQCPIKGFMSAPTPEQLRPTKREQHLLGVLWDWIKQGSKSQTMWDGKHPNKESK